jgi:hypothetical protein
MAISTVSFYGGFPYQAGPIDSVGTVPVRTNVVKSRLGIQDAVTRKPQVSSNTIDTCCKVSRMGLASIFTSNSVKKCPDPRVRRQVRDSVLG